MSKNHLHYQRFFYLLVPTESIPSYANQVICEILEINFRPVLLTVTVSTFTECIVTIVTMQDKALYHNTLNSQRTITLFQLSLIPDVFSI